METQPASSTKTTLKDDPAAERSVTVKLKPLRDGLKELENAYELMRAARTAFKEKIAAVAEKSGVEPSVIRAFVATRMIEDSEKADRKAEQARQLVLVFEEVGG